MANEGEAFTLWNSPMSRWTTIDVTVTEELLQQSVAEHPTDCKEMKDRLKPFETAVTEDTLRQLVG